MSEPDRSKISWDDLNDRKVDERLREQAAVGSTAAHYAAAEIAVPKVEPPSLLRRAMRNALVYLPLFGALAAAIGWAAAESLAPRVDRAAEAARLRAEIEKIDRAERAGRVEANEAASVRARVQAIASDNPFFHPTSQPSTQQTTEPTTVATTEPAPLSATSPADEATTLPTTQNATKSAETQQVSTTAESEATTRSAPTPTLSEVAEPPPRPTRAAPVVRPTKAPATGTIVSAAGPTVSLETFRADLIALCAVGVAIGAALATADAATAGRWRAALLDGFAGGAIGLAGGAGVALALRALEAGSIADADVLAALPIRILGWAGLGAAVGIASGAASRQARRAIAGLIGGAVGGGLGGAFFTAVLAQSGDARFARLAAALAIGVAGGAAIGLIERVVRRGWLRVVEGPIAGKQFILYRNPTLVGSAATSHIYLFRDPQVGKRHAAIFEQDDGYEIENLPLGGPTLVNDQAVRRVRLRHGDRVRVGRTLFVFEERAK